MKFENYNNIGISLVSFLSVVRSFDKIDYSKALLIQPLLLHTPLVNYVKKGSVTVRGIEDLILSKVEYFLNFNSRFLSHLPLSINTILLAEKMRFIDIEDHQIIILHNRIDDFQFEDDMLGKRAENIIKASAVIIKCLEEDSTELYFKLRVEL